VRFENSDGQWIELHLNGYEFPHPPDDASANWLLVAGAVFDGERGWNFVEPCAETNDVAYLAAWLEDLAEDRAAVRWWGPAVEPNLYLELVTDQGDFKVVRIAFEAESRPPWEPLRAPTSQWHEVAFDFRLSPGELRESAANLREELERFPTRQHTEPGPDAPHRGHESPSSGAGSNLISLVGGLRRLLRRLPKN
jgi:hypothetical protein